MGSAERRLQILDSLRIRKRMTIKELADKFGVSERTIQRDIVHLSLYSDIYTEQGRAGGVRVLTTRQEKSILITEADIDLLYKLHNAAGITICTLSIEEENTMIHLIEICKILYTKQKSEV